MTLEKAAPAAEKPRRLWWKHVQVKGRSACKAAVTFKERIILFSDAHWEFCLYIPPVHVF